VVLVQRWVTILPRELVWAFPAVTAVGIFFLYLAFLGWARRETPLAPAITGLVMLGVAVWLLRMIVVDLMNKTEVTITSSEVAVTVGPFAKQAFSVPRASITGVFAGATTIELVTGDTRVVLFGNVSGARRSFLDTELRAALEEGPPPPP
jgi:hypothetical protein